MAYEDELSKVWIFAKLQRDDLERIGKSVVPRSFARGGEIVRRRQAVAFYVIVRRWIVKDRGAEHANPGRVVR
jgi:hypothetical protein